MAVFSNILAGAAGQGGAADASPLEIQRSLRFNNGDSPSLSKTFGSSGDRKKWTFSCWFKLGLLGQPGRFFSAGSSSTERTNIYYHSSNSSSGIAFYSYVGGYVEAQGNTAAALRDPNAWYHLVFVFDCANSTNSDRVKIYINGLEYAVTFQAHPTNIDHYIGGNVAHYVGRGADGYSFDGYLAEVNFVNGQALGPTDFGEVSSTTGVWIPKRFTGSHGQNGFRLDFSNNSSNSALGNDAAGSNNWTVNNITASGGAAVTVANATGALPILNTSGDQGGTATSGNRTDSNASNLELALPLYGSNNATTFYDNSGNNRTVSNSGVQVKTAESRFYGSSAYFDGNDQLTIANVSNIFDFGTGDFTVEVWARPNSTGGDQYILSWECSGPNAGHAGFNIYNGNWRLGAFNNDLTGGNTGLAAGQWVHLAMARQGTTLRLFINGALAGSHTNSDNFSATTALTLGKYAGNATLRFAGYMNDFRVYKGVAKYTSAFTPPQLPDPVAAAGVDSLIDSPSNYDDGTNVGGNYATWSSLVAQTSGSITLSNGNLDTTCGSTRTTAMSSFPLTGKTYWEITFHSGTYNYIGMTEATGFNTVANNNSGIKYTGYQSYSYGWSSGDGKLYKASNILASPGAFSNGDVVGWAYDADNNTLKLYKNGSLVHTENSIADAQYFPAITHSGTATASTNFGQRPFAYPLSGYKSVCSENLSAPITLAAEYFDTKLYSGNGGTQTINLQMSPDLVWVKQRDTSGDHRLSNTMSGTGKHLRSNSSGALATDANGITAFNSDGFSLGSSSGWNGNSGTYVAWAWDAGSSTVSNTDGTITSNVRASASSGFSIIQWTGTQSNGTVGHGLSTTPKLLLVKDTSNAYNWYVFTTATGTNLIFEGLNTTSAPGSSSYYSANSSTISVNNQASLNTNNATMQVLAFADVEGFSKIGSYEGNGSSDGRFVATGFAARFLLIRQTNSTGGWFMWDTERDPFNPNTALFSANANNAEQSQANHAIDFLSNGFKPRNGNGAFNGSGDTYMYLALAESSLKYARAR